MKNQSIVKNNFINTTELINNKAPPSTPKSNQNNIDACIFHANFNNGPTELLMLEAKNELNKYIQELNKIKPNYIPPKPE